MRVNGIHRDRRTIRDYGDSRRQGQGRCISHDALRERPMEKLRALLCRSGAKTDGAACGNCEARCRFGTEYLVKKDGAAQAAG